MPRISVVLVIVVAVVSLRARGGAAPLSVLLLSSALVPLLAIFVLVIEVMPDLIAALAADVGIRPDLFVAETSGISELLEVFL